MADALWFEPQSLSVKALEVETPGWPKETAPLRAVLISDIHIDGIHMPPECVAKIVEHVNSLRPDIVFLAGDYIGAPVRVSRHTEDTANGWTVEGDRILIVTRGLGESGISARFGAAPEIMLLTIRPGQKAGVRLVEP